MLKKIKDILDKIIFDLSSKYVLETGTDFKLSNYYFAIKKSGSDPASPLRDRSRNNYNRGSVNERELVSDSEGIEPGIEQPQEESEEKNIPSNTGGSTISGGTTPGASTTPLKAFVSSPTFKFVAIFGVTVIGIAVFFISLFPPNFPKNIIELCGGRSKLDEHKIISRGPKTYNIVNGETIKPAEWWDAWDFYDYVAGVVSLEAGSGGADEFFSSPLSDKDKKERKYEKLASFAYYQAQALAAVSYALGVGNYISPAQIEANRAEFFEQCPSIDSLSEEEVKAIFDGVPRYARDYSWFRCPETWGENVSITKIANSNANAGACDVDYGCVGWATEAGPGEVETECLFKIDENGETVLDLEKSINVAMCNYTSSNPIYDEYPDSRSNSGKKISVRGDCLSYYKTNNPTGAFGEPLEFTCPNLYCKKYPEDPDCTGEPSVKVPKRAFVLSPSKFIKWGQYNAKEEQKEKHVLRAEFLRGTANSIRGLVMTDIEGNPKETPWKSGAKGTTPECKGTWGDEFPPTANDKCHDKSTDGAALNSWKQATEQRWPMHKIMSYWYDYYFSSWSDEGRSRCSISTYELDPKKFDELSLLNYDKEKQQLKFPNEKTIGNILLKYTDEKYKERVNITYVFNYPALESEEAKIPAIKGDSAPSPKMKKVEGYTFLGWYLDPSGSGERISLKSGFTEDITLYGKWTTNSEAPPYKSETAEYNPNLVDNSSSYYNQLFSSDANIMMDNYNSFIISYIGKENNDSGESTSYAAIKLLKYLDYNNLSMPYTKNGRYDKFGINSKWGTNSNGMPLGLDGIGLTYWSIKNSGFKLYQNLEQFYYAEGYSGNHPFIRHYDASERRVLMGQMGDVLYRSSESGEPDAKLVVGYYFNEANVLIGNIVIEAIDPQKGFAYKIVSVRNGSDLAYGEYDLETDEDKVIFYDSCGETDSCGTSYDVMDLSACYRQRQTYNDIPICGKYNENEYFKGVLKNDKR